MPKKIHKSECKIYVKSFPGAKTSCMKDYVKPSLRSTPNHFILHVGTNDLNSNQTSEVIAKEIVDLATSLTLFGMGGPKRRPLPSFSL